MGMSNPRSNTLARWPLTDAFKTFKKIHLRISMMKIKLIIMWPIILTLWWVFFRFFLAIIAKMNKEIYLAVLKKVTYTQNYCFWTGRDLWLHGQLIEIPQGITSTRPLVVPCFALPASRPVSTCSTKWEHDGRAWFQVDPLNIEWCRQTSPTSYHDVIVIASAPIHH